MPLTKTQQEQAAELLPLAHGIARRWSPDDEFISIAELALCEAVARWRPDGMPLDRYVKIEVWRRISTAMRSQQRRREVRRGDMTAIVQPERPSVLDDLRPELRVPADMFWKCGYTLRETARELDLPRREVRERLIAAANILRQDRELEPIGSLT